jgi:hypothetical protein
MTTNREEILQELLKLDDWNFMSTIQKALIEKNMRNKKEHKPLPEEKILTWLRSRPAQYVVALWWEPFESDASESLPVNLPEFQALAMHSTDQVDGCLEVVDDPESRLERRIIDASNYQEHGGCKSCGVALCAAYKRAYCPICGGDVYLT